MNKKVMITGSARGIGYSTVKVFAENGWDIVAHARKQTETFEDNIIKIANESNVTITPVYFDMLDSNAMKESVRDLKKKGTRINALINNAGISGGGMFQMTPLSIIKNVFNVNLFSHMELTQLVIRIMVEEKASIVNVASVLGIDSCPGNSAYGASKAAMISWTKSLQIDLAGKVRVNAVAPGLTETEMAYQMEEKYRENMINNSVISRLAKPDEIAKTIYFLASDDASFITGQVLRVDGGGYA